MYFQRNHFSNCYLQFVLLSVRLQHLDFALDIHAYKQGDYKSVEGYVENFTPASSGGEDQEDMEEESFDINGVHFSYGDKFIKKFGYHLPSTQGGYIKRDGQYLKLGYITTEKGYVIVKIQERKQ